MKKAKLKKDSCIYVRMTKLEAQKVKKDASEAHLPIAEYVRRILSGTVVTSYTDREQMDRLIYEVNKIGVNINQIAYHYNAGLISPYDQVDLERAIKALEMLLKEVQRGNPKINAHETSQRCISGTALV